jgi:hypothetical protein
LPRSANSISANPTVVGTSRVALPAVPFYEMVIRADRSNTGIVYIGDSTLVAAAGGAGVMFDLSAGESVTLKVSPAALYARASAASQNLYVTITSVS